MRNFIRSASLIIGLMAFAGSVNASSIPMIVNGVSPDGTANNPIQVTPPSGTGAATNGGAAQVNTEGLKATYSASVTGFTPVATPTDFLNIFGSSTKTIRITRIEVSGITTAATAAVQDIQVIKRSTAGTLNTAVLTALTAVPHDSASAAATAVVSTVGTANYQTLGTIVGQVQARKLVLLLSPYTATDFPTYQPLVFDFTNRNEQGIVLRGTSQQLALNWNGAALPAGTALDINITWTEE